MTDQSSASGVIGGPAPDGEPWEPADWTAILRRRRLAVAALSIGLVVVYVAFFAVLSLRRTALPTTAAWLLLVLVVLVALALAWPLLTAARRERWAERQRWTVRADHALRAHVSIGADDRDAVTERARNRVALGTAAVLGYPLLFLLIAFLLYDNGGIPWLGALLGTLAAAALCGWGLVSSRRRAAEGRRWLADPQPPRARQTAR